MLIFANDASTYFADTNFCEVFDFGYFADTNFREFFFQNVKLHFAMTLKESVISHFERKRLDENDKNAIELAKM